MPDEPLILTFRLSPKAQQVIDALNEFIEDLCPCCRGRLFDLNIEWEKVLEEDGGIKDKPSDGNGSRYQSDSV